ncbi:hypothetical protein HWD35_19740 [Tsukamurella tyrosinosolvens]|mgnify:FL=1|uniref:Uncharacterized protein n=1 Tax=Tsukamurella tyrosinosolvens TaxID=57704 RepID=A0A1H4PQV3_TSUTY|nr:hypothetical protein [Tsukamurella tyrosinosolvens]KXO97423.1 hypothetical protein AXK58_09430 [Tsukamurella tyrosinosolvens]KXP08926.1 hypothetical protein AXK59_00470 [Tsukamurella tyrosinosolvens]KZL97154.1 hypothetical protein AXX05_17010 [Tsukamurella tyrosinosolvens]MCA4996955.1 hypothetical protein [Tsukamurella tyrosinosolvens]MEC4616093.1 hypothetical protein [Tsukamurella tyrosinosolvens]
MSKTKAHKLVGSKPKKKCCRKKTRCMKCPVVIHKLNRMAAHGATKKELEKSLKTVRANPDRTRVA